MSLIDALIFVCMFITLTGWVIYVYLKWNAVRRCVYWRSCGGYYENHYICNHNSAAHSRCGLYKNGGVKRV